MNNLQNSSLVIDPLILHNLNEHGYEKKYSAGEVIYYQNQPSRGLLVWRQGRIKSCILFAGGTEKILSIQDAPSILGEIAVVDGGTNVCTVIAVTEVKASFIPREKVLELLASSKDLMMLFLTFIARKTRCMTMQAEDMASNIPQRLAGMLLNFNQYGVFTQNDDEKEALKITHEALASFLGTTRPKITLYLNYFEELGLIVKHRGVIKIVDHDGLQDIESSTRFRV